MGRKRGAKRAAPQQQLQQQGGRKKRAAGAQQEARNEYTGHVFGEGGIERVRGDEVTAEAFFERFVAARRPAVITAPLPEDLARTVEQWRSLDYLAERAGAAVVQTEVRSGPQAAFGQGKRRPMAFGELVAAIKRHDQSFYMSTQPLEPDGSGLPPLMASPVAELRGDFALRPSLLPTLVPESYNMWLGYSVDGSSTGLHHDFHDNLYVLVQGRKRFTLYSPADALQMDMHGSIARVHPNGNINYRGEMPSRADGVPIGPDGAVPAYLRQADAEAQIASCERAVAANPDSVDAQQDLARAEALLEDALDAMLEEAPAPEQAKSASAIPHFCKRPPRPPARAKVVELAAGELLYLPAGFFHEVTSIAVGDAHCALNYWFYPPDASAFAAPYRDPIWSRVLGMRAETTSTL